MLSNPPAHGTVHLLDWINIPTGLLFNPFQSEI